jgi:hypothetical protein
MPRRRAVTREQLEVLLALPATETELIRHWTLLSCPFYGVTPSRPLPISVRPVPIWRPGASRSRSTATSTESSGSTIQVRLAATG